MAEKRRVVVLVSGASSGIGNSCATALAKNGYIVYGTSRTPEARPRKADEFFELIRMDVSDDDSVLHAISYVRAREGRIDVLVHNAGAGIAGAVEETPILEAAALFDINVMGAARMIREVLPDMRKEGGTILVVGSMAGVTAVPFQAYYSASQHALEGLMDSMRLETAGFPVRISLIQAGSFRTGFTASRKTYGMGEKSPYGENGHRALAIAEQSERAGADPILVARLVMKLAAKKRVAPRYRVGFLHQHLEMMVQRLLPARLAELLLRSYYELHGKI